MKRSLAQTSSLVLRKADTVLLCALLFVTMAHRTQAGINVWTRQGPVADINPGVYALAIDPVTLTTLYIVTSNGSFKSTDGGDTWNESGGLSSGSSSSLAIDPATPTILYAATSAGVFKSMDSGDTWDASGLADTDILSLAVAPTTPTTLYAGTLGGIFKSSNGGSSWDAANAGLPEVPYVSVLTIDPATPSTIYAAPQQGPREEALYKSLDGGETWIGLGLPRDESGIGVSRVAIDPTMPPTVYALGGWGLAKSSDGGATWTHISLDFRGSFGLLVIDPITPTTLYAGGGDRLFKSADAGETWTYLGRIAHTLAIAPTMPSTVYIGGDGVSKSLDAGTSWNPINTGLPSIQEEGAITNLAADPATPNTIYAGGPTEPPGLISTGGRIFKSTDAGTTWSTVNPGLPSDIHLKTPLIIDSVAPGTLYAGGNGVFTSTDAGASWAATAPGLPANVSVNALAIDSLSPNTLYAGGKGVFKSTNSGVTWTELPSRINPAYSKVSVLAIDPVTPNTVYAATVASIGGKVHKSTDGGETWAAQNLREPWADIYSLAVDPLTPSTLYAGACVSGYLAKGYRVLGCENCTQSRVFKSTDAGATWAETSLELPRGCTAIGIDPTLPSTMYVSGGSFPSLVFKSTDAGATWTAVHAGLADVSVYTLAVDPFTTSRLYAGTDGGVFSIQQTGAVCVGDCHGVHTVGIDDLVTLVSIALDEGQPAACPDGGLPIGGDVDVAVIIEAVNNALSGCGGN